MKYSIWYLIIINLVVLLLCEYDKRQARSKKHRLSEKLFFSLSLLGGALGMWLGMYLFHHKTKHPSFVIGIPLILLIWVVLLIGLGEYFHIIPHRFYTAEDFHITVIKSDYDKNKNGIDDYTDILLGAKMEAKRHPQYKSVYYQGGYAPLSEGVCTDVVIRSLANAGYNIKEMIDEDIKNNLKEYPRVAYHPDPNIDFRRVKNMRVFFDRYLEKHTLDLSKIEEWMPGDIVIFGRDNAHIGIISSKRNKKGIPYLIHNAAQPNMEEDSLESWAKKKTIVAHYRFLLVGEKDENSNP